MATAREIDDAWLRVVAFDETIHQMYPKVRNGDPREVQRLKVMWLARNMALEELLKVLETAKLH
ncbi:MAG TPA: hypothetical protein VGF12_07100 [Roseateles sp.]|uniref:hypothetical protein n=1 Tax=Roseateles sp. TaxID=1971397 RepID=UPI002ED8049A